MKTILQKHKSKFVVNLLNGLGIVACVSLTACGNEKGKDRQTENEKGIGEQIENLVEKLKSNDFYKNLAEDEDSLKKIAEWLIENDKGENYKVTSEDLKKIFPGSNSGLNVGGGKQRKINDWLNKLKSLNDTNFNSLYDDYLKEKVAQKFIDNNIGISKESVINAKLDGFVAGGIKEKKESEVIMKVEGKGTVSITSVVNNITNVFDLGEVKGFQNFVEALKNKKITKVYGEWSLFIYFGKVSICESKTGLKIVDVFESLVKFIVIFSEVEGFCTPHLSLVVRNGEFSFCGADCSMVEFCKGSEFWNLVKDHADLFYNFCSGVDFYGGFVVEKDGDDDNAVVKIDGFVTSLKWNEVFDENNKFIENSGWNDIFILKNKTSGVEDLVTIEWSKGGYSLSDGNFGKITSLRDLIKLSSSLKGKNVTVKGEEKFGMEFYGTKVKFCGDENDFKIWEDDFERFISNIEFLNKKKVLGDSFKIKIAILNGGITLNGCEASDCFMESEIFWDGVRRHVDLFEGLPIKISKDEKGVKGKIGDSELEVEVFDNKGNIKKIWEDIFEEDL